MSGRTLQVLRWMGLGSAIPKVGGDVPQRSLFALLRGGAMASLFALCGLACSGSSQLNPVQGKVLYKNEPLAGALVTLHPKGSTDVKADRPVGRTKDDGTFTVTTGQAEGAPPGEYMVTIICSQPVNKKGPKSKGLDAGEETEDVLKGMYADPAHSKITVTIKSGPNQLEPFNLK
jgi:hypothetical protein